MPNRSLLGGVQTNILLTNSYVIRISYIAISNIVLLQYSCLAWAISIVGMQYFMKSLVKVRVTMPVSSMGKGNGLKSLAITGRERFETVPYTSNWLHNPNLTLNP